MELAASSVGPHRCTGRADETGREGETVGGVRVGPDGLGGRVVGSKGSGRTGESDGVGRRERAFLRKAVRSGDAHSVRDPAPRHRPVPSRDPPSDGEPWSRTSEAFCRILPMHHNRSWCILVPDPRAGRAADGIEAGKGQLFPSFFRPFSALGPSSGTATDFRRPPKNNTPFTVVTRFVQPPAVVWTNLSRTSSTPPVGGARRGFPVHYRRSWTFLTKRPAQKPNKGHGLASRRFDRGVFPAGKAMATGRVPRKGPNRPGREVSAAGPDRMWPVQIHLACPKAAAPTVFARFRGSAATLS